MSPDARQSHPYPDRDLDRKETWGSLIALETYFGKPLAEGLAESGIRRIVEVGCGYSFIRMKKLARLTTSAGSLFAPDDLLAIDPGLLSDNQLGSTLGSHGDNFRRKRLSAEQLGDEIKNGEIAPFDLVISKGVVSLGWDPPLPRKEQERIDTVMRVTEAMRSCLRVDNPHALLIIEAQIPDEILLFSRDHLRRVGLEIVYYEMASDQEWTEILPDNGIFPPEPEDAGYRLVICKPK